MVALTRGFAAATVRPRSCRSRSPPITQIWEGGIVQLSGGLLIPAKSGSGAGENLRVVGVADQSVDNNLGTAGDKQCLGGCRTTAKSMSADRPNRCLGLVHTHDTKPRRRLHEVMKEQGWKENQPVTFLTDGSDTVQSMALYMAPGAEHLLNWFHITMRITVMRPVRQGTEPPQSG